MSDLGKDIDGWFDELGPEFADRFVELRENPGELIAALRESPEFAAAVARADTRPYLRSWFEETEGWTSEPTHSGSLGEGAVGVEWAFDGVHSRAGAFNGLAASNRSITVRGFSILGEEEGRFVVRRYVDWAGLFGQLGLSVNWRIPLEGHNRRDGDTAS